MTTASNDGVEWEPYSAMVNVGFDCDDMWVQGLCKYLPEAWIKGTVDNDQVTFANPQLLGSYETLLYFKSAEVSPATGATTQKDMVCQKRASITHALSENTTKQHRQQLVGVVLFSLWEDYYCERRTARTVRPFMREPAILFTPFESKYMRLA